ncbi:unnamed protein product [Nippostrongylus brasiliensis]|uniref:Glycosyltransferase family 92 protein n=1 Tax=Nippostrongylus brasiliensis TaxID=27835 RepID=A0A158QXH5_NIPBR|nr:unnamed protein product [Nippostrongylus brasiliensis]
MTFLALSAWMRRWMTNGRLTMTVRRQVKDDHHEELLFPTASAYQRSRYYGMVPAVWNLTIDAGFHHYAFIPLQIVSQTYRQFCASVFRPCLAFAWVAAGYVDDHPGPFTTPTDYAFNKLEVAMSCQGREEPPKYRLSHCLSPLYGNEPKWLVFTEFIEHYKLVGVEHFYIYIKDIDDYSRRVLDDYLRSGEIETTHLKDMDKPGGVYLRASIPGSTTLIKYLPTLTFHNTTPAQPHFGNKCIVDSTKRLMKPQALSRPSIFCCAALVLGALHILAAFTMHGASKAIIGPTFSHETIRTCLPFYALLDFYMKVVNGVKEDLRGSMLLIAAYAFPDYSVITFDTHDFKGQKAHCWYYDEKGDQMGPPSETVTLPRFTAHCCRRPGAHFMSISSYGDRPPTKYVPVQDRTKYGVILTSLIKVLDNYVKSGDIETTYLQDVGRPDFLYIHTTIPGNSTLLKHLPTLVFHNTTPAQPHHGSKTVVDPTMVMAMELHMPTMFFSYYKTYYAPTTDAFIRILMFGQFEKSNYPENLMSTLYQRVKSRLEQTYHSKIVGIR